MSGDPLEAILNAQNNAWNERQLPRLVHRAALPPIAPKTTPSQLARIDSIETSRPATSAETRPPTSSIGFPPLPKLGAISRKPLDSISEKPQTPIYPIPRANISYSLNLNEIDNDEILRPESVASTEVGSERESVVRRELKIPETFSEFRELSVDLDQISSEDIERMRNGCASIDHRGAGILSVHAVLNEIRIVHPSDTWQNLLDWLLATSLDEDEKEEALANVIFLLDYVVFFDILINDKHAREVQINIPEVLESDGDGSVFSRLPDRPTSSQEQRERWRVKLLMDLEIILSTNPDIDIERFKNATEKKIISVEELKMLLQIYGLTEHIQQLEERIIECFLTHDHFFCFSAFVGCLNQINPAVLNPPPPMLSQVAPWDVPPLASKLDDSGVIPDLEPSGSRRSTSP